MCAPQRLVRLEQTNPGGLLLPSPTFPPQRLQVIWRVGGLSAGVFFFWLSTAGGAVVVVPARLARVGRGLRGPPGALVRPRLGVPLRVALQWRSRVRPVVVTVGRLLAVPAVGLGGFIRGGAEPPLPGAHGIGTVTRRLREQLLQGLLHTPQLRPGPPQGQERHLASEEVADASHLGENGVTAS